MKALKTLRCTTLMLTIVSLSFGNFAKAKEFYKMSTLGPGSTPYVVMSTFAKIIGTHVPNVEIQVNATGAATRHAVDAARGKIHFFMGAPSVHSFMTRGIAMYKTMKEAPELAKNLRGLFNFRIGSYHVMTYADSGIKTYTDMKGKKVFTGPPTGAAKVVARAIIAGPTGYKPNKDYEEIQLGWGAAAQAFQDRQLDVYINPTNAPSPVINQIVLTNKVRLLGLTDEDFRTPALVKAMKIPGRTIEVIDPAVYGSNLVNTKPLKVIGAWVGLATQKDVPGDVIYAMLKAFWENVEEMHLVAPWAHVITMDIALKEMNMPLHSGAVRYYKEQGMNIPASLMP